MPVAPTPFWKRLWLLFSVIWVVVAALNVATILAFAEGELERAKALTPALLALVVPPALYLVGLAWEAFMRRKNK